VKGLEKKVFGLIAKKKTRGLAFMSTVQRVRTGRKISKEIRNRRGSEREWTTQGSAFRKDKGGPAWSTGLFMPAAKEENPHKRKSELLRETTCGKKKGDREVAGGERTQNLPVGLFNKALAPKTRPGSLLVREVKIPKGSRK